MGIFKIKSVLSELDKSRTIYLDYAAAAPVNRETADFYHRALMEDFANQEALHFLAYEGRRKIADAAGMVVRTLTGTDDYEVVWGDSATELSGLIAEYLAGRKVISSALEHPALTANLKAYCQRCEIGCNRCGELIPEKAEKISAVVIHRVQSELGLIQDTEKIFDFYPGALKIVDAVQAAGKLPWSDDADITIISGVKFGAPAGAALLVKKNCPETEKFLEFAAAYRKKYYRMSRIHTADVRSFAFALDMAEQKRESEFERISMLQKKLTGYVSGSGVYPTLPESSSTSCYITHFLLKNMQGAVVVRALSEYGICVGSGSACASESASPSAALTAIGIERNSLYGGLRVSMGEATTEEEIKIFADKLNFVLKNY